MYIVVDSEGNVTWTKVITKDLLTAHREDCTNLIFINDDKQVFEYYNSKWYPVQEEGQEE